MTTTMTMMMTTVTSCGGTDPGRCNLGRIAIGGQATVTVSVTPTTPDTITNQAWVAPKKTDPNAANNSVSTATTVVDVTRTTPLGLENPLSAGCEFVNGEIACPEMASSSSQRSLAGRALGKAASPRRLWDSQGDSPAPIPAPSDLRLP